MSYVPFPFINNVSDIVHAFLVIFIVKKKEAILSSPILQNFIWFNSYLHPYLSARLAQGNSDEFQSLVCFTLVISCFLGSCSFVI